MSEFGLLYGWIQIKSRACSPQYVATAHLSFTLRAHSQAPIFQVPFLCFTIYSLRLFFPLLYGFFVHVQIRAESLISLPSCLISLKGPFTCDALSACVSSSCGGPAGSVFIGDNHLFFFWPPPLLFRSVRPNGKQEIGIASLIDTTTERTAAAAAAAAFSSGMEVDQRVVG